MGHSSLVNHIRADPLVPFPGTYMGSIKIGENQKGGVRLSTSKVARDKEPEANKISTLLRINVPFRGYPKTTGHSAFSGVGIVPSQTGLGRKEHTALLLKSQC